ncbi:MAG: cell division protein FtsQ/DivIB, partial [Halioglobus sp.]|nr:cell division protein FtsQ/DivIB [Halioglobus sp.]
ARKPVAGERSRRPAKGATRKSQPVKTERRPAAWLNRVIVLTGAGIVLVAALQGYIALQSIPVQYIKVTGELAHTRTDLIQEMIQPALVGGFLRADLQRIRTQLEELPWIYQATVQRRWPNALEIHVVEQLPIARWGDSGFLNHEGQVFQSESSQDWQALPRLDGPRGSAQALVAGYQRLVEILAPVHLSVAQLTVDERDQVEVVLAGGIRLLLGSEDFLERMHRFVAIYRTELAARAADVERVDLRYETGVAVAFTESSRVAGI